MPKEEWGVKRVCPTTGRRFYDLNKDPIVSPYSGDVVNMDAANKSRVLVADKVDKASAANQEEILEEEAVIDEDDTDTDVDLGDDVLDEDDDDNVSLEDIADVPAEEE